jgi:hypothetical protein
MYLYYHYYLFKQVSSKLSLNKTINSDHDRIITTVLETVSVSKYLTIRSIMMLLIN